MNKTGICPKCGSGEVVRLDGQVKEYGAGSNLWLGKTTLSAVPLNQYICTTCGYVEHWVDMIDMDKIHKSKKIRRKS